jgi:aminoglycoside 2''-phosphotransferase
MKPSDVAEKLRKTFADLPDFERIRLLAEGFGSQVYLLDDEYIFRIAKSADVGKRYGTEMRVLPHLQRHLALQIPRPLWHDSGAFAHGVIGYRKIRGVPFALELTDQVDLNRVAHSLAAFIFDLHSAPISEFEPYGISRRRDLEGLHDYTSPVLRGHLPRDRYERLAAWWDSYLVKSARANQPLAVLHGDLWGENLILGETCDDLVGVVDFEAVSVGDVARDFAPQTYLGQSFFDTLIGHYQSLGGQLGTSFLERLQDELLLRELTGLRYALEYPEADELGDALSKVARLRLLSP